MTDENVDRTPSPRWIKARRSDNANACVEVLVGETYSLRDSKLAPNSPVIELDRAAWRELSAFLLAVRDGDRPDGPMTVGTLAVSARRGGGLELTSAAVTLTFTAIEHECFVDGIGNGEFEPLVATAARA